MMLMLWGHVVGVLLLLLLLLMLLLLLLLRMRLLHHRCQGVQYIWVREHGECTINCREVGGAGQCRGIF